MLISREPRPLETFTIRAAGTAFSSGSSGCVNSTMHESDVQRFVAQLRGLFASDGVACAQQYNNPALPSARELWRLRTPSLLLQRVEELCHGSANRFEIDAGHQGVTIEVLSKFVYSKQRARESRVEKRP